MAKTTSSAGGAFIMCFGLVFTVTGLAIGFFLIAMPLLAAHHAKSWTRTPCVITASRVVENSGGDSTTYAVEVAYTYRVDGREHRGTRWSFAFGSSSGRADKQAVVNRFPAGNEATCLVDPKDPESAVLEAVAMHPDDWWLVLFPIVFGGAGLVVVWAGMRSIATQRRQERIAAGLEAPDEPAVTPVVVADAAAPVAAAGPLTLDTASSRWTAVIGLGIFALVWNGIVMVMGVAAMRDTAWVLVLFLGIFGLIGLLIIFFWVRAILCLWNPQVTVVLPAGHLIAGSRSQLTWTCEGRTDILDDLVIKLVCRERATYRRGTTTATDKHDVAALVLERHDGLVPGSGTLAVHLFAGLPPSWKSDNNALEWELQMDGSIARWPDLCERWDVPVAGHVEPPAAAPEPILGREGPFALRLDTPAVAPGEAVMLELAWEFADSAPAIVVRLAWRTEGKGTIDTGIGAVERIESPAAAGRRSVRLIAPAAPASWQGALISVLWRIEVEAGSATLQLPLIVSPTRAALRPPPAPEPTT